MRLEIDDGTIVTLKKGMLVIFRNGVKTKERRGFLLGFGRKPNGSSYHLEIQPAVGLRIFFQEEGYKEPHVSHPIKKIIDL